MASLSVREVFRQARSAIYDPEDSRYGDLDGVMADAIAGLFEGMAESELERRIGAKVRERCPARKGYRNGHRLRQVQTSFTTVTVRIPRLREEGFVPQFLQPNRRAVATTEQWVERAFLCGASQAEIVRLMESVTGCRPSDGVLRGAKERLDELVRQFRERPLEGQYVYLFLDAAWVKDIVGTHARRICILCAIGVTADGKKEILGFKREARECASSWGRFLENQIRPGLDPAAIALVVSDEHGGIIAAVQEKLGDVRHQYCWAHRCRNVLKAAIKTDHKELVKGLRAIYQAEHETAARAALRQIERRWSEQYPGVMAELKRDAGNLLAFYHAPELHREYVRTSNPIERPFLELRRSTFGCGAFANRESCDRVCGHTFIRLNQMWQDIDLWEERRRRRQRAQERRSKEQAATLKGSDRPAHRADPVAGAQVALQQSPILPDGRQLNTSERAA